MKEYDFDAIIDASSSYKEGLIQCLEYLKKIESKLYKRFEQDDKLDAISCAKTKSDYCEAFLKSVFSRVDINVPYAIGIIKGFARSELAPYSDIDLVIILDENSSQAEKLYLKEELKNIFSVMEEHNLEVTPIFGDYQEIWEEAHKQRRHFLSFRYIYGVRELFNKIQQSLNNEIFKDSKLFALEQLEKQYKRKNDKNYNPYIQEPNILSGEGCIYDIRSLRWVASLILNVNDEKSLVNSGYFSKKDARALYEGLRFFWDLRTHMHLICKRNQNVITVDIQEELAQRLKYKDSQVSIAKKRFMRHLFLIISEVEMLVQNFFVLIEENLDEKHTNIIPFEGYAGLSLQGRYITYNNEDIFKQDTLRMLEIFLISEKTNFSLHPNLNKLIVNNLKLINSIFRANSAGARVFLQILFNENNGNPYKTLRLMSKLGVLGKYIPYWAKILGYSYHNMWHKYTADEHTLQSLNFVYNWIQGKVKVSEVLDYEANNIYNYKPLLFALFCQCLAKEEDYKSSEVLVRKLGKRLLMEPADIDLSALILKNYYKAYKLLWDYDIDEIVEIIKELAQTPEQLKLLMIIFVVNSYVCNNLEIDVKFIEKCEKIYSKTVIQLSGMVLGISDDNDIIAFKQLVGKRLMELKLIPSHLNAINLLEYWGYDYWQNISVERTVKHFELLQYFYYEHRNYVKIADIVKINTETGIELDICCVDRAGLLPDIAQALAYVNAEVLQLSVFRTMKDLNIAIQEYVVCYSGDDDYTTTISDEWQNKILDVVSQVVENKKKSNIPAPVIRNFHSMFKIPTRVSFDNTSSDKYTTIEVVGRNRKGFLFTVSSLLNKFGLNIISFNARSYAERAIDVIVVEHNGKKFTSKSQQALLERNLKKLLG